ncbi:uncharacterized protein PAC_13784 [Phialocephala subalpina]|uniref:FAD-binding PCMH-type domain-containing protein n=1 Tax=Phialocephala subalpina TaxID=576137 RepID=A0A1L7XG10_9HELO|nr:uncharacterized protein PAC_13784 [Phialocephala subalpina]
MSFRYLLPKVYKANLRESKILIAKLFADNKLEVENGIYTDTEGSFEAVKEREASFWSANAPLSPLCIVQPLTTTEVSTTVKALACSSGNFTIRSGGHGQWTGASDIHNGVTIDLGAMNSTTYDPTTTLASIQPGPRWGDVYT